MKIYLSCDIEGTNGIAAWSETEKSHKDWAYFAEKMTAEVAAACEGINDARKGVEIFVKDAHDSAMNLDHEKLPENVVLNRGWSNDPYSMMFGIDRDRYDACMFTGYHNGGSLGGNPLAHTMSTDLVYLRINGEIASEFLMNYYAALANQTPVVLVVGDQELCAAVQRRDPAILTVAAKDGFGGSVTAKHPLRTLAEIRRAAARSLDAIGKTQTDLPSSFETEICFRRPPRAIRASFYPGARLLSPSTVGFDCREYVDFLRFFMFVA